MILDTSALIAMLLDEGPGPSCLRAAERADGLYMSAASALEAAIVVDRRRNPILSRRLDELRVEIGTAIHPVTAEHVAIARQAYRDYGTGSGHPAQLNFGDCFAYALAADRVEPLLCVGDDFKHTDLELVELEA